MAGYTLDCGAATIITGGLLADDAAGGIDADNHRGAGIRLNRRMGARQECRAACPQRQVPVKTEEYLRLYRGREAIGSRPRLRADLWVLRAYGKVDPAAVNHFRRR